MSRVTIETYRGYEIEFDTGNESFLCICTEEDSKVSKSYSAVKKYVDDYVKNNQNFKSFKVVANPKSYFSRGELTIVGIRKDGQFIGENKDGVKVRVGNYEESDYIVSNPKNDSFLNAIKMLDDERKKVVEHYDHKKEDLIAKLDIVTLKEYKKQVLNQ